MNNRIVFCASLAMALFLVPEISIARLYNANSGRFQTMDTFQGIQSNPQSLHKYLYAHADPVNNADPSGKAVYKVQYKSSIPGIDHRIIVGDTGTNYLASSYVLEFWGDDGIFTGTKYDLIKHAKWHYTPYAASASDTINALIQKHSPGKIDATVVTSVNVDQNLNQEASKLDGKDGTWVAFFNDCGTGANDWLAEARNEQFKTMFRPPITGGANYIYNFNIDIGSLTGM